MKMPNVFLVGAPKCATTAISTWLASHPDVFMPDQRDLHYFGSDLHFPAGRITKNDYLATFAGAESFRCVAESSVWYLYSEKAAAEIARFQPDARIIIAIRNPMEVIPAHHSQMRLNGLGDEDIADLEAALAAEEDRRQGKRIPTHCSFPDGLLYREVARFSQQVQRYLTHFPREHIHCIVYDDLAADPQKTFGRLLDFLDLETMNIPDTRRINPNQEVRFESVRKLVGATPPTLKTAVPDAIRKPIRNLLRTVNRHTKERPPISIALRRELNKEFGREINTLSSLIERDLSHWITDEP